MNTREEVNKILKLLSGKEAIDENDNLQENIALDSLGMVTLLVAIEERFDIKLDESDMNPFDLITVSDVTNLVKKYINGDIDEKNS